MYSVSVSAGGDATAQEVYLSRFSQQPPRPPDPKADILHGGTCENVPRARARGSTGFERSGIERGRLVQQRRFPASISPAFASKCVYKIVFFHKSPWPTSRCTPWWLKRPKRSTQFLLLLQKKKAWPTSWGTFARVFIADSESRSGPLRGSTCTCPPQTELFSRTLRPTIMPRLCHSGHNSHFHHQTQTRPSCSDTTA